MNITKNKPGLPPPGELKRNESDPELGYIFFWTRRNSDHLGDGGPTKVAPRPEGPRFSLLAVFLILTIASVWSTIASIGLLGWDPHVYYGLLVLRKWQEAYPFEPTLFLIATVAHPWSFPSYMFATITIALSLLLIAFRRLGYSPLDQLILILFFSCSFYGLHFMVAFQRQFFGIVLFVLAVAGGRGSTLARIASLLSHLYTFILHGFWFVGRLRPRMAALVSVSIIALASILKTALTSDTAAHGSLYGEQNFLHLLLKQLLTISFSIIILSTLRKEVNNLRSIVISYIALGIPCVLWPSYAGLFSRIDYFFLPIIVAFWPRYVRSDRVVLYRLTILCFSLIGSYIWIKSNFLCEVMSYCEF